MRRLLKWMLRGVLVLALVLIGLLLPVAYVEVACTGGSHSTPQYVSILPPEHHRPEARTLLTYPEWHIVHAYDDYGRVIKDRDPHDFGYTQAVRTYWSSLCALKKQSAFHGGMDTATKQLVYVIGVSFTAELAMKAAYEETLGRIATWIRGAARSPLDDLSAQQAAGYATFLQQVPWYKWDFPADIAALDLAKTNSFRDRERRFALGGEFAAKASYAQVIAGAVASVGADELTLRMIVKGLDVAKLRGQDWVTVIDEGPNGVEIETTRYRALTELLKDRMSPLDLQIVEIAGNDDILFTATGTMSSHPSALFSFPRQGYGDYRHLFLIKTRDLLATLDARRVGRLQVEHVHDY